MLIEMPCDPTRTLALAAEWPGIGHWSWADGAWLATFGASACLLATPSAAPGGVVLRAIPDEIGAREGVILRVIAIAPG